MGDYKTQCPCGGGLYVVRFTAQTWIPLTEDGFSTQDAKFLHTEDERVRCDSCEREFTLGGMTTDEEETDGLPETD